MFQQDVKRVSAFDFEALLWAFIDADTHLSDITGAPENLVGHTNLYLMFTTSEATAMEHSERLYKLCGDHYEPLVSRRNTPSVSLLVSSLHAFIHHLVPYQCQIHGLTNEQQNIAEANFEKLGPIPRLCIDFVEDPSLLIDYENRYQAMATSLTYDNIRHFVLQCGTLDLDAKSHTMFIIRRNEVDDLQRRHLEPISANAKMQLMVAINALERFDRVNLCHCFAFTTV